MQQLKPATSNLLDFFGMWPDLLHLTPWKKNPMGPSSQTPLVTSTKATDWRAKAALSVLQQINPCLLSLLDSSVWQVLLCRPPFQLVSPLICTNWFIPHQSAPIGRRFIPLIIINFSLIIYRTFTVSNSTNNIQYYPILPSSSQLVQDLFHPQCDHLSSWPRLSISSEKLRWARSEDDAEPEQPRENKENNTQKGGKKGQWRCPKSVSARWDLHNNFHGRSLCLRERCMKWMPVWALESPWIPLLYLKPHGPNNGGLGQSPIPANVKKPCLWNLQFQ